MTYFGFLFLFLGLPILVLAWLTWRDRRAGRRLGAAFSTLPAVPVLLLHVLIALVYTTPWDNYLVATGVWWYDPALVTGLTIGWVPIEEYTFFVVQPLFTGLLLLWLARREPVPSRFRPRPILRWLPVAAGALVWLLMVGLLVSRLPAWYLPGTGARLGSTPYPFAVSFRRRHPLAPSPPRVPRDCANHDLPQRRRRHRHRQRHLDNRSGTEPANLSRRYSARRGIHLLSVDQHIDYLWHDPRTGDAQW
jgi:lycopene cyclase domain-containing protein